MIDIGKYYEKSITTYAERHQKIDAIRRHENKVYGIENYYGLKDFANLSDRELDKRIAEITIEKARDENGQG